MKKNSAFTNILFVLLVGLIVSACSTRAVEPVVALALTNIPVETNIPSPTATLIPESTTPVQVGVAVQSANFEVKVIALEKPFRVYSGGDSYATPGKGNLFLGLGVKVNNLTGSNTPVIKWSDIYLANSNQERWYPVWGTYQKTNEVLAPLTIKILEFQIDPNAEVFFGQNGYLRLIYRVPKDEAYYYFGFADLPLTVIDYKTIPFP